MEGQVSKYVDAPGNELPRSKLRGIRTRHDGDGGGVMP